MSDPCLDPDFSVPLPGTVTHWVAPTPLIGSCLPKGFILDPWDQAAARPCERKNPLPPVPVFDGTNPRPHYF